MIRGKPFFYRGPPSAVLALEAIGVGVAGVANNHVLDYGEEALRDTLAELHSAGITAVGAGLGEREARRSATVATDRGQIGVVAVSDHPREYAAGQGRWGMALADLRDGVPAWLDDELERLRRECDVVIAFPHWGHNMTTRPTGWQREAARRLQAAGADLVAGHSSHCFHGVEMGPRGPILSDLGGALDDYRVDPELRNDLGVMAVWRPAGAELELVGLALGYARPARRPGARTRLRDRRARIGLSGRGINGDDAIAVPAYVAGADKPLHAGTDLVVGLADLLREPRE